MNTTLGRIRAIRNMLNDTENQEKTSHTIEELFVYLEPTEFALAGLLLSTPFLQPVPLPGLSTPLGLLLAFLGFLQIVGKGHLYLPIRVRQRKVERETIQKILAFAERLVAPLSKIPHCKIPDQVRILCNPRVLGVYVLFMAFLLALPLPIPFSNTIPAWGIVFCSLTLIESNGYFLALIYLILVLNLFFFGTLVYFTIQLLMSEGLNALMTSEGLSQLTALIRNFF
ncbi:MAG: hypothetical protein RJB13_1889 [Pseudomonadota bacterium]|jgi:hypothetical protein